MKFTFLRNRFALVVIPVTGVALAIIWWFSVQHRPYAILDDYRMVTAVKGMRPLSIEGHAETEFATGRLVPALLFDLVWTGVRSINDLWYVRTIGLLVVAGTIVLYQIWFIRHAAVTLTVAKFSIAISSFLVLLLPCVSATTTWAQKTTQLFAFPLALLAGVLATSYRITPRRWCGIATLVFLSVFCYQHFVVISMLPLAIAFGIDKSKNLRPPIGRVFVLLSITIVALLTNVAFVRLVAPDVLQRVSGRTMRGRIDEALDVLGKGPHIFVEKDMSFLAISVIFISVLVVLALLMNPRSVFLCSSIVLAALWSVAITIGGDGDSSYRITFPTQLILWLGLGSVVSFSLQQSRVQFRTYNQTILVGMLLLVAVILAVESRDVVGRRISAANSDDWINLNCHLESLENSTALREIVVKLSPTPLQGREAVASEIGLLARHIEWIFRDQWALAISSNKSLDYLNGVKLEVLDHDQKLPTEDRARVVIDLQSACPIVN